ncbi:WD40 repeat domain-containing protein [Tautonia sp. JC769]|uniref:WD40 repeat domain-containing protein n=1 Tax=Tautonia sp. JC769 TaxID=3232135 RepID=UPI00345B033D
MIHSGARPGFGPEKHPTRQFSTVSKRRVHTLTPGWFAMVVGVIAVVIGFEDPIDRRAGEDSLRLSMGQSNLPILRVAFTPDDSRVATLEGNSRLAFWEAKDGGPWITLGEDGRSIQSFAFDPESNLVAVGGLDGSIRLTDVRTGEGRGCLCPDQTSVRALAFSPDGGRMASGHANGHLRIWEVDTGAMLFDRMASETPVIALNFSPDGGSVASTNSDGLVSVWESETGLERASVLTEPGLLRPLVFSADGQTLWWITKFGRRILRWDLGSGGDLQSVSCNAEELLLLPHGRSLLALIDRERVWQLDAETLRVERRYRFPGRGLSSIALSRDGTRIALGGLEAVEVATLAHFEVPTAAQ